MKLRIVYDNEAKEGLESDWGFACLLEAEKKILFDTGASAEILSRNMQRLELKKEDIEIIALSSDSKKGFYKERNKPTEIYYEGSPNKSAKNHCKQGH